MNIWSKYFAADRWRRWHGGNRPVERHTWVEVRFRDGECYKTEAIHMRWKHVNAPSDIVAYRVIL